MDNTKDKTVRKENFNMLKISKSKCLYGMVIMCFIFLFMLPSNAEAATHNITIYQYLSPIRGVKMSAGVTYYEVYPNQAHYDYKKFMKYTYKISDDSVIGLVVNANSDSDAAKWINDKVGFVMTNNVEIHSLTPGTATLKVYNGSKLVDTYTFTVVGYLPYSPSSFVNDTYNAANGKLTKTQLQDQNKLIQKIAKTAADLKYTTTNQRIQVAINEIFNYSNEKIVSGNADFSSAVLNNLGFKSESTNGVNTVEIYNDYDKNDNEKDIESDGFFDEVIFGASDPDENYDFSRKDTKTVYSKTHLPAWIIGEDTPIQKIDVGQTKALSSCDLNEHLYSSDSSIVTVSNGEITGVKPGYAMVYRYNDTYFDAFFVFVKNKGAVNLIKPNIFTKTVKSYFKESDRSIFVEGISDVDSQVLNWDKLRMFEMEPAFGHGGSIKTKYVFGTIKCYLDYNGESTLLCRIGVVTD